MIVAKIWPVFVVLRILVLRHVGNYELVLVFHWLRVLHVVVLGLVLDEVVTLVGRGCRVACGLRRCKIGNLVDKMNCLDLGFSKLTSGGSEGRGNVNLL